MILINLWRDLTNTDITEAMVAKSCDMPFPIDRVEKALRDSGAKYLEA